MESTGDISHSFTDLMTSLTIIFILLLVATLNNEFTQSEEVKKDLKTEVIQELKKLNLTLTQDPNDPYTQIINLDEDKVKFELNSSELKDDGLVFIGKLFQILSPSLCKESIKNKIESVIIEGHTDSIGNKTIEGKLKNVKLSQDRAYSVMNRAFNVLNESSSNNLECLRLLISATGRGSNRPLINQNDDANRRVEIKIRVKNNLSINQIFDENKQ